MKTRSVALFLLKSIVCAFLFVVAIDASACGGCNRCVYKKPVYNRCVYKKPCCYHHYYYRHYCRVIQYVPCDVYWNCSHYSTFDGSVSGQWVRLQ